MATSVADLRRQIASDSRSPLSAVEQAAYEFCRDRAAKGLPITRADIAIAIGSENLWGGTAPGVLNRLEQKGYIDRTYYQRGLQVCIPDTGQCTAPPASRSTHWRLRDQKVGSPALHMVRNRNQPAAKIIEQEASAAGRPLHEFMMDLVFNGLELWLEKRENQDG